MPENPFRTSIKDTKQSKRIWPSFGKNWPPTQETVRKDHFQSAPVLEVDRQIKLLLGESDVRGCDAESLADED
jgi:hypothetical protein